MRPLERARRTGPSPRHEPSASARLGPYRSRDLDPGTERHTVTADSTRQPGQTAAPKKLDPIMRGARRLLCDHYAAVFSISVGGGRRRPAEARASPRGSGIDGRWRPGAGVGPRECRAGTEETILAAGSSSGASAMALTRFFTGHGRWLGAADAARSDLTHSPSVPAGRARLIQPYRSARRRRSLGRRA